MLQFHIDVKGLIPWQRDTTARTMRAMKNAGSSALRSMRTEASKNIREKKGIQVGQIDKALRTIPANTRPVWTLLARAKPLPLIAFGARQVKSGVSVEVTKGKRMIVRHAFLATMQSGHKGVFMRHGPPRIAGKGRYAGKRRQPIVEKFTAPVSSVVAQTGPLILERGKREFQVTFTRMMRST